MNRKVKVIRKAIQPQFPISGGPPQMVLTGGGGEGPRKKQSLPVRILGGAGSLAGGALGALGSLAGRHRSAGGLLQGMVSGAATGSALGRGLGQKAGGLVAVGGPKVASAARYLTSSKEDRLVDSLNREAAKQGTYRPRLTYRGQPIVGGKVVPVTGGSTRTTDASAVSDNNVNRVLDATKLGDVRVLGPGEREGMGPVYSQNPLAVAETGNPLDMNAESELNRRAIEQLMNPPSGPVGVVDTHPVQSSLFDSEFNPAIAASPIGRAGMMAGNMVAPIGTGYKEEIAADDKAAEATMNLDTTPDRNLSEAFKVMDKTSPAEIDFSNLEWGDNPNQLASQAAAKRMDRADPMAAFYAAADEQGMTGDSFYNAFNRSQPMDIAFRLLKMMSFYR